MSKNNKTENTPMMVINPLLNGIETLSTIKEKPRCACLRTPMAAPTNVKKTNRLTVTSSVKSRETAKTYLVKTFINAMIAIVTSVNTTITSSSLPSNLLIVITFLFVYGRNASSNSSPQMDSYSSKIGSTASLKSSISSSLG